jgi:hypothetical protein
MCGMSDIAIIFLHHMPLLASRISSLPACKACSLSHHCLIETMPTNTANRQEGPCVYVGYHSVKHTYAPLPLRPIFFDPDAEAEKRRAREHALVKARQQGLEQQRRLEEANADEAAMRSKAKLGQPGFRWHASRPQVGSINELHIFMVLVREEALHRH